VRALHYSALALVAALALGGCSRQPPLQAAARCVDLTGAPCAVRPDVARPGPSLSGRDAGEHRRRSPGASAVRHKRARHHVAERHEITPRQPQASQAAPVAAQSAIPQAKASPAPTLPQLEAHSNPSPAPASSSSGATVQEQVAVATALAERITALSALPAVNMTDQPEAAAVGERAASPAQNHLVAVLMVRPGVGAISDLRGRIVAIDERYAAARIKVRAGMAAAGAPEVQLTQGQGTAINRLTNGEVAAAIVAVVVPDAAEAFPEIAGYKTFRVTLPTL
jgi:hypothetical protein